MTEALKLQYLDANGAWHWLSRDMPGRKPQPAKRPHDAQGNASWKATQEFLFKEYGLVTRACSWGYDGSVIEVLG